MNAQQLRRSETITQLVSHNISVQDAAHLLGVSPRHVRRLRHRFTEEHLPSVVHGNTCRAPINRTDPQLVKRVVALSTARLMTGSKAAPRRNHKCNG